MSIRTINSIAAVVLVIATGITSAADTKSNGTDTQFIKESIQGNLAEQKVGELAEQKGASAGVRSFGAMLKKDHGAANRNAMQTATSLGVTPPSEPNAEQKAIYEKLSKLSGDKFDKEFVQDMVSDHKKDVRKFEQEQSSSNATVANYAKETLPDLKKHLQTAQNLEKSLKSSS